MIIANLGGQRESRQCRRYRLEPWLEELWERERRLNGLEDEDTEKEMKKSMGWGSRRDAALCATAYLPRPKAWQSR